MTKLDVLDVYREIPFCAMYELDGCTTSDMPPTAILERAKPRYETLVVWLEPITGLQERAGLPKAAKAYLERIEQTVGAPIGMVGVGPERTATLL